MGTAAELQTEWARLVVGSLARAGVRRAIVSPGSRSTPFVVAAIECEHLRLTTAIDERSAAHFALGQARATEEPSLLLCTSGSAPANYYPAIVEAYEAGVPLVVLSADRPPELHGCGANQTTEQVGLFGNHVRFFANLGEPRSDVASLRAVRRVATQAVSESLGRRPGPVHLNAQARKPLEPELDGVSAVLRGNVDTLLGAAPLERHRAIQVDDVAVTAVVEALSAAERPAILCGPGPVSQSDATGALRALAERTHAVLLAEGSSQLRFGEAAAQVLGAFDSLWSTETGRTRLAPDFVLQLGQSPVSRGWSLLADRPEIRRVVVHPFTWADPSSSATTIVESDVVSFVDRLVDRDFPSGPPDSDFARKFVEAEGVAWAEVDEALRSAGDALTEAAVAPTVVEALPTGAALVVGNSLPIRHLDRWVRPSSKPLPVFAQRGVSGIDGLVSATAGVASVRTGPLALLLGDLSLLHDVTGVGLAARATAPLLVVVINNGGGRIFEQLPIADRGRPEWLPYFTTPQDADLGGAAKLYGCRFATARTVTGLRSALQEALAHDRCTMIEACVPPDSAKVQGRALLGRIDVRLAAGAP